MKTVDLVEAIFNFWTNHHEEVVQANGQLLKKAIDLENPRGVNACLEEPAVPAPRYLQLFNQLGCKEIEVILQELWSILPWDNPSKLMNGSSRFNNGQMKVAELFSNDHLNLRLIHLEAGIKLPQHAKSCRELLHILSASKAKIGPIDEWTKDVTKRFYEFLPTAPQVIEAAADAPVLYLSLWQTSYNGQDIKFWFSNLASGDSYSNDIMAIQNVEAYYNKMASDYEDSMFGWGYCMPEAIADALVKHGGLKIDAAILDLGCGNGLCGQALINRGVENLSGIDFSSNMLKQCTKRAIYKLLQKHDLFTALPFNDNKFDCLISVAVTTYLKPEVLRLWLKVAKPNGLIAFTHKTSVWPEWEIEQDQMESEGLWKKVWVSHPIPYLPSLKEAGGDQPCQEMAKVYIYKKL